MVEPFQKTESTRVLSLRDTFCKRAGGNEQYQITAGITTRLDGVSEPPFKSFNLGLHVNDDPRAVFENRHLLGQTIQMDPGQWVMGEQVHNNKIQRVGSDDRGRGAFDLETVVEGVDGLYTTEPNLLLGACYADCVPLYFYSPDVPVVGVAHAGWRGTVSSIGGKMIEQWKQDFGIKPDAIEVAIGPSIGPCCYEVDDRVIDEVNTIPDLELSKVATNNNSGRYMLDLKAVNKIILQNHGIDEARIHMSDYCTSCRTDLFFSHRKEKGKSGRILGYIGIKTGD